MQKRHSINAASRSVSSFGVSVLLKGYHAQETEHQCGFEVYLLL